MTIAICTILLNERPYLAEWLAYHHLLGVRLFRIYVDRTRPEIDDDGTTALLENLAQYYNIEVADWTQPGPHRQVAAFDAGLQALRGRAEWAAFIDVDEFLRTDASLPQFLAGLPSHVAAVGTTQLVYGSSGRLDMPSEPVTNAYRMRATTSYAEHRWFKSIVRPAQCSGFINSHMATLDLARYVLGDGLGFQAQSAGCATRIPESGVRLHHYMLKSRAEWRAKRARGALSDNAVNGFRRFDTQYFARDQNCNLVPDATLANLAPAIQAQMALAADFVGLGMAALPQRRHSHMATAPL